MSEENAKTEKEIRAFIREELENVLKTHKFEVEYPNEKEERKPELDCPECGKQTRKTDRYCANCGTEFGDSEDE